MLVLSRKIGQSIVIDGNVTITVNRIGGKRITLGIEAPNDVRVVRGELRPFGENASGQSDASPRRMTTIECDIEDDDATQFVIRAAQLPHSHLTPGFGTA
ncbi:MAG: carbon storage regulator [Planctomycetales bacterium]|nr:carbon storage regulator [Planctomycetales bacterium]